MLSSKDSEEEEKDSKNIQVEKFQDIDNKNYYTSISFKYKTMFNNTVIVRPNYSSSVCIRE